jgi:hypothetical protein
MLIAFIVAWTGQSSFNFGPDVPVYEQVATILGVLAAISALLSAIFAIWWLLSIFSPRK